MTDLLLLLLLPCCCHGCCRARSFQGLSNGLAGAVAPRDFNTVRPVDDTHVFKTGPLDIMRGEVDIPVIGWLVIDRRKKMYGQSFLDCNAQNTSSLSLSCTKTLI